MVRLPPVLLLLLLLLLSAATATTGTKVLKIMVMDLQPLQPFNQFGAPCANVSASGCRGGFPAVNAVMREESRTADATVKFGALVALSRLVLTHPTWIGINYRLYKQAGYDALLMHQGDLIVSSRFSEVIRRITSEPLPVVHSNLNSDAYNMRAFLKYSHIKEFDALPGVKLAFLVCYPSSYGHASVGYATVVKYITTIREAWNVTHVVVSLLDAVIEDDLSYLTQSGVVDAILFHRGELSPVPKTPTVAQRVGTTWQLEASSVYPRVDTVSLEIDTSNSNRVVRAQVVTTSSGGGLPEEYKTDEYRRDLALVQHEVDVAKEADEVLGESLTPMPHSFHRYENGTTVVSCRFEECHLGTFMVDAMYAGGRASDIVLLNAGNMFSGWDAGEVRFSEMARALPYRNTLCYLTMTAAGLWRALEHGVSAVHPSGGIDPNNATKDLSEQFLQVRGMRYSFNPELPIGSRITRMEVPDGNGGWGPIDTHREYSVTTTNWVCTGGDGHNLVASSGEALITQLDQWAVAAEYLREMSPYTPKVRGMISIDKEPPPLHLAKTKSGCGEWGVFVPFYEACQACPEGYYNPPPSRGCVLRPVPPPPPPSLVLTVMLPILIAVLIMFALGIKAYFSREKSRKDRQHRYAPRSGRVAIVFTDIQGSSALWAKYPGDMDVALTTHHTLARKLIEKHHGYEVKTIGDSFMVAFADPVRALGFACEFQEELKDSMWPDELLSHTACQVAGSPRNGLRSRIGVHIGEPIVKTTPSGGYDYEGNMVNIAARVADSGHGGQILITEEMYKAVEHGLDQFDTPLEVTYLGSYLFKGLEDPVECIQVLPGALARRTFPELRGAKKVEDSATLVHVNNLFTENSSANTAEDDKKEQLQAVQTLSRYFAGCGPSGCTVQQASALLAKCLNSGSSDAKIIAAALTLPYNPEYGNTIKWSSFIALCRQLPGHCLAIMAASLPYEGSIHSGSRAASLADPHAPSPR